MRVEELLFLREVCGKPVPTEARVRYGRQSESTTGRTRQGTDLIRAGSGKLLCSLTLTVSAASAWLIASVVSGFIVWLAMVGGWFRMWKVC